MDRNRDIEVKQRSIKVKLRVYKADVIFDIISHRYNN